jgi:hypothetical protein
VPGKFLGGSNSPQQKMKRKPETIKDLARRVAAELAKLGKTSYAVHLYRDWTLDPQMGLSPKLSEDLLVLHEKVARAIPDDIGFSISFDDGQIYGSIEFDDGPMTGGGHDMPVLFNRHFLEELRSVDWDEIRGGFMEKAHVFDGWTSPDSGPVPEWFMEYIRQGGR